MDWIKNITDGIKGAFEKVRLPITPIPPILLLCEIMNRPGLSAIALTGAVISKLQSEGFETGATECGEPNYNNKFVKIFAEEFVNHVKMSGVTQMIAQPGDLSFIGMGGNAGGPVTLTLINNNMGEIGGIVE
jgi:hypothetical protein